MIAWLIFNVLGGETHFRRFLNDTTNILSGVMVLLLLVPCVMVYTLYDFPLALKSLLTLIQTDWELSSVGFFPLVHLIGSTLGVFAHFMHMILSKAEEELKESRKPTTNMNLHSSHTDTDDSLALPNLNDDSEIVPLLQPDKRKRKQ